MNGVVRNGVCRARFPCLQHDVIHGADIPTVFTVILPLPDGPMQTDGWLIRLVDYYSNKCSAIGQYAIKYSGHFLQVSLARFRALV